MKLFISYSRDDSSYVYELAKALREETRHDVWIDQKLVGADFWWDTILDEIEKSDCFVVTLTPRCVESIFCAAELAYAIALNKPILPLLLKPCEMPSALKRVQHINIQTPLSLEKTVTRCVVAISEVREKIRDNKFSAPTKVPARPIVPEPKADAPEQAYELFVAAEEAAAAYQWALAERHFEKAIKADPRGPLGSAAQIRLEEIRWERERTAAYANIARLAANTVTLKGAQAAWRAYVTEYGTEYDPQSLGDLLNKQPLPTKTPSPIVSSVAEPPKIVSPPAPAIIKSTPKIIDVREILPPPFEWCDIPAGKVTLETGQTFEVAAFWMAKYPITNVQYEVFIEATGGYAESRWWDYSEAAKQWRTENKTPKDTGFAGNDLPRTKVTWYEAVAFCRWLSSRTRLNIMLPSEQQWQRAAQGDDGREYPWGNGFDESRCNTSESGIRKLTPVIRYPNGASPYGVMDMAGNVWEWCLNDSNNLIDMDVSHNISRRWLRGGAFYLGPQSSRSASRSFKSPGFRGNARGFRVACVPPSL